ncbi:MAG: peptidase U32 family protein [Elusimicrobiales bacterium]|nr:peptidase U32 family protein [Elusimicrobiales bacterium]
MEILAPAGSKESFVAAIKAGADSVYVGLKEFNARQSAPNLDLHDLAVLTDYAHSRNVKVYLTLNILLKHEEINDAVRLLSRVSAIGVDAVIVQDLGLARIVKDFFPGLRLHASTQLACHNSSGAKVLAGLGFRRVVLARELTLAEIKLITGSNKSIEYEIFAHGALCFSISGMCLFSSLIGGSSGNRGRCTQPCRRLWRGGKAEGYLFSPKDLELFDHLEKIRRTGVGSLKIEGRMRSSEYVHRAVSQYRTGRKGEDLGRRKTACLFSGRDEKLFEPGQPQCLGVRIGSLPDFKAKRGDRVRVVDPKTDRSCIFKYGLEKPDLKGFRKGSPVYLAGTADFDGEALAGELDDIYRNYRAKAAGGGIPSNQHTSLIARVWPAEPRREEKLRFRIDDAAWLELLGNENIIFAVNRDNLRHIPPKAAVELPPFIAEREMKDYRHIRAGEYVLNNISHFDMVPDGAVKTAGPWLYAWNAYAARALKDLGVGAFFASWEDDALNIGRLKFPLIVTLFGKPVITRSRMLTKEHDYGAVRSEETGTELDQSMEGGLSVLTGKIPVMLFNAKEKLKSVGVNEFCVDLSRIRPDRKLLAELRAAYASGRNFGDSVAFNFRRGVK